MCEENNNSIVNNKNVHVTTSITRPAQNLQQNKIPVIQKS